MKRGMTKADKKATKVTGGKLAKSLLKIMGVGLAAGVALVALTDKTMKKVFPEDEKQCCDKDDNGSTGGCGCGEDSAQ